MWLGYKKFLETWGPTAIIETDAVLMFVDPRWELEHDFPLPRGSRGQLMFEQCGLLAESFFKNGFEVVVIGGNALHTPEELDVLLPSLLDLGEVFHVTLDPSLEEIQRRIRDRGDPE